ncbi:hypothetical protein [Belnapia sp. F-4-1]|nr:hypothetical protein [Belnapia sp. F-4-1]
MVRAGVGDTRDAGCGLPRCPAQRDSLVSAGRGEPMLGLVDRGRGY